MFFPDTNILLNCQKYQGRESITCAHQTKDLAVEECFPFNVDVLGLLSAVLVIILSSLGC